MSSPPPPPHLPTELQDQIHLWLHLFHQADATDRLTEFRRAYRVPWARVCEDIRTNTPLYTMDLYPHTNRLGRPFHISVSSPLCDPGSAIGMRNSGTPLFRRRALSLSSSPPL